MPVLGPGQTIGSVTDTISDAVLKRPYTKGWLLGAAIGFALVNMLFIAVAYLLFKGVGIWGIDRPVMWGFAIINFVWWIGIGHAGTLISAILLLLKQEWRTSINRFAEAMTLFAVACAGMFPLLHMGRPWFFYWLVPYPNTMALWPQFRSPLVWDVFAVSTYAAVSLLFWYVGLIPDLATLRDRAKNKLARMVYAAGAMGWTGSARHWKRYQTAYLILAGLSTPLVVSVHTVVSFDFTIGIIPGWHSTIFPPYFVAGAIYVGLRDGADPDDPAPEVLRLRGLDHHAAHRQHGQGHAGDRAARHLRLHHRDSSWRCYSGNTYEGFLMLNRLGGPYARSTRPDPLQLPGPADALDPAAAGSTWSGSGSSRCRQRRDVARAVRHRGHEPAPRLRPGGLGDVLPDGLGLGDLLGTIGLFFTLIFLFIRFLPAISISEMQELAHVKGEHSAHHGSTLPSLEGH